MSGAIVGPRDAIILGSITEKAGKLFSFVVQVSFLCYRRTCRHIVGRLTTIRRFVQAIIFPRGGTEKGGGQFVAIVLSLETQIGQESRILFGCEFGNKPTLCPQGSQASGRFNDLFILQRSQTLSLSSSPDFGDHMRAWNVVFRLSRAVLDHATVLHVFSRLHSDEIVSGSVVKRCVNVVEIDLGIGTSSFNGNRHIKNLAEQNLHDPRFEKDGFPILRVNAHFRVIHGRETTVSLFHSLGWVIGIARSDAVTIFQLFGQTSSLVIGIGTKSFNAVGSFAHFYSAIENAVAGYFGLHGHKGCQVGQKEGAPRQEAPHQGGAQCHGAVHHPSMRDDGKWIDEACCNPKE
mmetsp:Transcript_448/g.1081  ORF Transcript_448/g.1081 Transcript_448/m.1081 type:complete len:348 (+) Transcript_448:1418-2461(+)